MAMAELLVPRSISITPPPKFGCDLVCGFAGRIVGKPIDQSMDRYVEVFEPLAKRAADNGVRLAFENCDMDGTWQTGDWNIAQYPVAWEMMFNALPMDNIGLFGIIGPMRMNYERNLVLLLLVIRIRHFMLEGIG